MGANDERMHRSASFVNLLLRRRAPSEGRPAFTQASYHMRKAPSGSLRVPTP